MVAQVQNVVEMHALVQSDCVMMKVRAGDILFDRYQRTIKPGKLKEMIRDWDWRQYRPVIVSFRVGSDKIYAVDGWHRVNAVLALFGPDYILVVQAMSLTYEEEAHLFAIQDRGKTSVSPKEKFFAHIEERDMQTMQVVRIVDKTGWRITPSNNEANGNIQAVGALVSVYVKRGPKILEQMLRVLAAAYDYDHKSVNSKILSGLSTFFALYADDVDEKDVIAKLSRIHPTTLIRNSAVYSESGSHGVGSGGVNTSVGRAILDVYNSGRRTRRLEWRG